MDVELSADQRALVAGAREVLHAECPVSVVRAAWEEGGGHDERLWGRLAEAGFLGLVVPEDRDGMGLGDLELALLLEQAGRVALPEPLLECAIGALAVAESGTDAQRQRWLPAVARGEAIITVQLEGQPLVVGADIADVVVLARDGQLHAVPASGFRATEQPAFDRSRRLYSVEAEVGAETAMAAGVEAVGVLAARAAVAAAGVLVGIAAHLVEASVDHVQDRHQFGRPVGSFQAVKHRLADAHLAVELARPATWVAAHLLATRSAQAATAASVAKAYASGAATAANEHALQCHGGIGFTWEHDLHLWLKRGKALEQAYGSARFHRRRLADLLFETELPA